MAVKTYNNELERHLAEGAAISVEHFEAVANALAGVRIAIERGAEPSEVGQLVEKAMSVVDAGRVKASTTLLHAHTEIEARAEADAAVAA